VRNVLVTSVTIHRAALPPRIVAEPNLFGESSDASSRERSN
jgi:hypothetical protein